MSYQKKLDICYNEFNENGWKYVVLMLNEIYFIASMHVSIHSWMIFIIVLNSCDCSTREYWVTAKRLYVI